MVLLQTKHKLQLGLCVCATKMRLGLLYARNARCPALPCLGFRSLAECRKRRRDERGVGMEGGCAYTNFWYYVAYFSE